MSAPKFEIVYDGDFLKDASRLPAKLQQKLSQLIEILYKDPFDSRLHTKPLSAPLEGMFSFRITRDYRVGFKFQVAHVVHLLVADRRDKIYKRLERKR